MCNREMLPGDKEMRPSIKYLLPILGLLVVHCTAYAEEPGFASYDECILESLKGVSSDVAASAIIASCRSAFPETARRQPLRLYPQRNRKPNRRASRHRSRKRRSSPSLHRPLRAVS